MRVLGQIISKSSRHEHFMISAYLNRTTKQSALLTIHMIFTTGNTNAQHKYYQPKAIVIHRWTDSWQHCARSDHLINLPLSSWYFIAKNLIFPTTHYWKGSIQSFFCNLLQIWLCITLVFQRPNLIYSQWIQICHKQWHSKEFATYLTNKGKDVLTMVPHWT